jgi:hypothetical protein
MDRRRFSRVNFEVYSEVSYQGKVFPGKVKNLSLKGFYFVTENLLPVGAECELKIVIKSLDPPLKLRFQGKVVRQGADGFGAEIIATDIESLTHLKNILAYNLGETETFKKEITSTY